ncbi:beta strand repeat-containing protein [Ereboglobus luteus]|uniref:beta strand repeat-containing protein n=1 Tax=Ereboglobus luteus TaxID=1796921 RepID=UPI001F31D161|nr:hypothetical protein [Ereboglobus luteus]
MRKININRPRVLAALMSSVFAFVSIAHGQNRTWTGSGGDSNWSTAGNWSGNALPTGTAVFNASTYPALAGSVITLGSAQTIGGFQAVGPAGGSGVSSLLTIGSGVSPVLSFNNGASISLAGGLSLAFGANVTANGSLLVDNRSNNMGTISFLGALDAGSNAITFNTAFTDGTGIVVNGALTAGDITKTGDGTIRFSSATAATVTGNINFNAGRIIIDGNNVLGDGVIRLGSGGNTRQLAITGSADYSLRNALDLTTDLNVFRLDEDSATSYRKLTLDPSSAFTSNIGASGTLTVGKLVDLALGENQNFSGGTLAKTGGGILRLSGAGSTFAELVVTQGSVLADIRSDMTLGGGSSIFGAGKVTVDGGDTVLGITSNNAANIFTLGAGADIELVNGALFSLDNAALHLQSGTINTGTTGRLQFDGKVMLGSTVLQGTSLTSNGIALGGDVVFTNNTGIVDTASHLFRLSNTGTQVLSHNGSGGTVISGDVVKTGAGRTVLDSSLTSLTFGKGAQLNAGVFDLGTSNLVANANDGVTIGSGTLSFGKADQLTGVLTYAGGGVALMNGYSQTISNVAIGAAQIGLIKLGGDVTTSTTLALGELSFGSAGSVFSIAGYMAGANSDRIFYSGSLNQAQLSNNVWFYGYNPGVRLVSGELLTPLRSGTNTPDFLQVEWTNADNDLNAANYKNWRTLAASGSRTGPLALPNAPGVEITFNDNFGSISGKTVSGAGFAGDGGTWTVGKLIFNYSTVVSSALNVNAGAGVVMVFDSGVDGQAAEIRNTTGYYPSIAGTGTLRSNLLFSGSNNMVMEMAITGSHNMIVNRPGGNLRWGSNSSGFTGDFILNAGSIYIQRASASFGSGNFIINGGAINGQTGGYQAKRSLRSKLVINSNFSANWVWFDYGGMWRSRAQNKSMSAATLPRSASAPRLRLAPPPTLSARARSSRRAARKWKY